LEWSIIVEFAIGLILLVFERPRAVDFEPLRAVERERLREAACRDFELARELLPFRERDLTAAPLRLFDRDFAAGLRFVDLDFEFSAPLRATDRERPEDIISIDFQIKDRKLENLIRPT
jgi:hypothetical protein